MSRQLKKILCIDDESDILQIAKIALEHVGGFEVVACSSAEEALRALESISPDLILLDVMMPEKDGPATLAELQKIPALKGIPIIFMTARVQLKEINEYKSLGAYGVIAKPFDPMNISNEVTKLWEQFHGS